MRTSGRSAGGPLLNYLHTLGAETDVSFLRETLRVMTQMLMEMEVSTAIEASPYERNDERRAYRNGYRERTWKTGLGEIPLRIPKLRKGTYYPSFIDSWPEAEQALLALIQDAYVQGVSLENVEAALEHIGIAPAHRSQIADLSAQLDDMIYEFRQRPLRDEYAQLWLDVLKLDAQRRFDVAVAVGLRQDGGRDMLGFEVTPYAEGRAFWSDFLGHLVRRGLSGVETVVSAPYEGLKPALRETLSGAEWQQRPASAEWTPIMAIASGLWADTRIPVPDDQITSSLSVYGVDFAPVYGQVDLRAPDIATMIRLVGGLLLALHQTWQVGLVVPDAVR